MCRLALTSSELAASSGSDAAQHHRTHPCSNDRGWTTRIGMPTDRMPLKAAMCERNARSKPAPFLNSYRQDSQFCLRLPRG